MELGKSLRKGFAVIAAFAATLICSEAFVMKERTTDGDGHVLVRKWETYEKYAEKDLPQKQEEALKDIIDEAFSKRLSWDFFDASLKYYTTVRSRDWKRIDDVSDEIAGKVIGYGDPVVTYNISRNLPVGRIETPDIDSLTADKSLAVRRSPQFYGYDRNLSGSFPEYLRDNISCDLEYLLWSYLMSEYRYGDDETFASAAKALRELFHGKYPQEAYVEFLEASREENSGELEEFARKYDGKAVALFAEALILQDRFEEMENDGAVSDDYRKFRESCAGFEERRAAMKGDEKKLVGKLTSVKELLKKMDAPGLGAKAVNDRLSVYFKNMDRAEVTVVSIPENKDGEGRIILEKTVLNDRKSYYTEDTVEVLLPGMDDGDYNVTCRNGKIATEFHMSRYTVSMAMQFDDEGCSIYAADFMSGRPADTVNVSVSYQGKEIWSEKGLSVNGFTRLGNDFPSIVDSDAWYYISCSYTDKDGFVRKSEEMRFNPVRRISESGADSPEEVFGGRIFMDRAAFNPGDTLKFKAILYTLGSGEKAGKNKVADEGLEVKLELRNAENEAIDSLTTYTNGFGSVSGAFRLPDDQRNGTFVLRLLHNGKTLDSSYLTVDEFELPNLHIGFDDVDKCYLPGDTVEVTGKIESYSGRSLSAADISYMVSKSGEEISSGALHPGDDGSFSVIFKADDSEKPLKEIWDYYSVDIRITDATGETMEASAGVIISDFRVDMAISEADGAIHRIPGEDGYYDPKAMLVDGDTAAVTFSVRNANYCEVDTVIEYSISKDGETLSEGKARTGEPAMIDLSSYGSGMFRLEASASFRDEERKFVCDLVKTAPEDSVLTFKAENYFKVIGSEDIRLQFGAGDGPVWAVVQLLGCDRSILRSETVYLDGIPYRKGSLAELKYEYRDEYPESVRVSVLYFRNGDIYRYSHDFDRPEKDTSLPLVFSRFTEKAYSGDKCHYELATEPGTECLVSVFDKSTEAFRTNRWNRITSLSKPYSYISCAYCTGDVDGWGRYYPKRTSRTNAIPFQLTEETPMFKAAASDMALSENVTVSYGNPSSRSEEAGATEVKIRDNFSKVLAFYPHLESDADGTVRFSFDAGDRLSTFYVSVFAHDRNLRNNTLRRQMTVSLPVELSVVQPDFLYEKDSYSLRFSLSNMSGETSEGMATLYIYDRSDYENATPVSVSSLPCNVGSGKSAGGSFDIEVPEGVDTLGIKLVYSAENGYSDGLFVTIPVRKAVQTLTESHSAVWNESMDADSLYAELQGMFVNTDGSKAVKSEISVYSMIEKAIPESVSDEGSDVVSVSVVLLADVLASGLKGSEPAKAAVLAEEVLSYQNNDGGFGWFKGSVSSPVITALVLERFAAILQRSPELSSVINGVQLEKAVRFLDGEMFSIEKYPLWGGGISLEQYLYIRSMYNRIPLSDDIADKKEMKNFRKAVKEYLVPKKKDDPAGYILAKARRISTMLNFMESGGGDTFSEAAGLTGKRMGKAVRGYMESLKEYAVNHPSGGMYYPNAVLPFRGLLENEVYAHYLICDLMSRYGERESDCSASAIAEGIRLWIMLQKETQQWSSDPAFLFAIGSVMDGSEKLLSTKILVLTAEYVKPFEDIKAASNGISVQCAYYRIPAGVSEQSDLSDFEKIGAGDTLNVGDKVVAVYDLWSAENRSFVRLSAPHHPCLRPEKQLSGYAWLSFGPLRMDGFRIIRPYAYREVKADRGNWYFDVFPEEEMQIREVFHVTQCGVFNCPAAEIECLYAPHYRGNADYSFRMTSVSADR